MGDDVKAGAGGDPPGLSAHRLQPEGAGALRQPQAFLDRDQQPDARHQQGLAGALVALAVRERPEDRAAHHRAIEPGQCERAEDRHQPRQRRRREPGQHHEDDDQAGADAAQRGEFPEREIDPADQSVDQRGRQRQQRQNAGARQAADHLLERHRRLAREDKHRLAAIGRAGIGGDRVAALQPALAGEIGRGFAKPDPIDENGDEIALGGGIADAAKPAGEKPGAFLLADPEADMDRASRSRLASDDADAVLLGEERRQQHAAEPRLFGIGVRGSRQEQRDDDEREPHPHRQNDP